MPATIIPKTYIPAVMIIILGVLKGFGIQINEEMEQAITLILIGVAGYLIRRNMIKSNNLDTMKAELRKEIVADVKKLITEKE